MKYLLVLILFASPVYANLPMQAPPVQCECTFGGICNCGAGCKCPAPIQAPALMTPPVHSQSPALTIQSGCPNGQCQVPQQPQRGFRLFR